MQCFLFLIFTLTSCSINIKTSNEKSQSVSNEYNEKLKIHYIDVGQGDSILVQKNYSNMLIDTGTNDSTEKLISYLKKQNIRKIDYLILTHPHEDHIGGADAVIKDFDIGKLYMPKVGTSTKTFRDVLMAMKNKDLKANEPELLESFKFEDANCTFYGPINSEKKDLNTYSIILKLTYGSTKFLFTGDAQAENERAMISKGYDLSADVLKLGHHGSRTSTSNDFLDKVNPKYTVISCGKENDYGHPHKETVNRLKSRNIPLYRTDENGTIICTSDGKNISFNCSPGDYRSGRR
ncbi:competence protein ComE [Clostridium sp. DMHC 10]|nr:competence protein ComE [Clostridium sp. DMHC 10]